MNHPHPGFYRPGYRSLTAGGDMRKDASSTDTPPPPEQPTPLATLSAWLAPAMGALSAVVAFLVSLGLVNQATADTINAVGGAAVTGISGATATGAPIWAAVASGLIAAATAVTTSLLHASLGKRKVTPTEAPRNDDGVRLVPEPRTFGAPAAAEPAPATTPTRTVGPTTGGFRPDLGRGSHERSEGNR